MYSNNKVLALKYRPQTFDQLIGQKVITSGMIPKVETCIETVENGTDAAVILDGRAPHATLMELFTEHGGGTLIRK